MNCHETIAKHYENLNITRVVINGSYWDFKDFSYAGVEFSSYQVMSRFLNNIEDDYIFKYCIKTG